MTIRYPNGKRYNQASQPHKTPIKKHTYSNRGMSLEEELNETNEYYLTHNIACVHKKTYTSSNCKSGLPRSKSSQW